MDEDRVAGPPQTDAEFLQSVNAPRADEPFVIACRRVLTAWCGLPPDSLRADAKPRFLHRCMKSGLARGWDEAGFLMKLEEELHAPIDMNVQLPPFLGGRFFLWSSRDSTDLGDWIRRTIEVLRDKIKYPD